MRNRLGEAGCADQVSLSGVTSLAAESASPSELFPLCSGGKRYHCCCCCCAKIRQCEQGLCCNSAARQGKKDTACGGTLVVPHGTPHQVPQVRVSYRIPGTRYDIWYQGFTTKQHSKQLSVRRAMKPVDLTALWGLLLHLGASL